LGDLFKVEDELVRRGQETRWGVGRRERRAEQGKEEETVF
jgi:hypothetical protein